MSQTTSDQHDLAPGDPAPDISLLGAIGQRFSLAEQRGKRRTLLIFYPQDMTSG